MNHDRREYRDGQRKAPRRAQDPHPDDLDRERGEIEPEPVGSEDIEQQPGDDGRDPRDGSRASDPGGEGNENIFPASRGQQSPAQNQADGDQPREPRRAELLARHGREPLDMPEDDAAQRRERGAGQGIVELYLASPTALRAEPRFASEAAMNLAVSAGSAHTTPKPRLAMNSLYSFES